LLVRHTLLTKVPLPSPLDVIATAARGLVLSTDRSTTFSPFSVPSRLQLQPESCVLARPSKMPAITVPPAITPSIGSSVPR